MKIFLIFLLAVAGCRDFYYAAIPTSYPTSFYTCLKNSGMDKITIVVVSTNVTISSPSIQSVNNAKNSGLEVEIVLKPCRSLTPEQSFNMIVSKIGANVVSKVWVEITTSSIDKCSWSEYPPEENCRYLQSYIEYFRKNKIDVGVVSWRQAWALPFNGEKSCPEPSSTTQFWWLPNSIDEQDGQPNFNNYIQIGGWKKPFSKFYAVKAFCGVNLFVNYYE